MELVEQCSTLAGPNAHSSTISHCCPPIKLQRSKQCLDLHATNCLSLQPPSPTTLAKYPRILHTFSSASFHVNTLIAVSRQPCLTCCVLSGRWAFSGTHCKDQAAAHLNRLLYLQSCWSSHWNKQDKKQFLRYCRMLYMKLMFMLHQHSFCQYLHSHLSSQRLEDTELPWPVMVYGKAINLLKNVISIILITDDCHKEYFSFTKWSKRCYKHLPQDCKDNSKKKKKKRKSVWQEVLHKNRWLHKERSWWSTAPRK